jgi:circadian clock protein KaiB
MTKPTNSTHSFEIAADATSSEKYLLRLYVAGSTPGSTSAVQALKAICEEHLQARYMLEVIDVYQQPVLARDQQIIAVPTLVKHLPLPMRRILGDLSNKERVLLGLDLKVERNEQKRSKKRR